MLILLIDLHSSIGHHNRSCNWFIYTNSNVCGKSSKSSPECCHQLFKSERAFRTLFHFFFYLVFVIMFSSHGGVHFLILCCQVGVLEISSMINI